MGIRNHFLRIIHPWEDERWDKFVNHHPHGSIFHLSNWAMIIQNTYRYKPYYIIIENNSGEIEEGFPIFLVDNRLLGKKLISLPFTDYIPCLVNSEDNFAYIIEKVLEIYRREKCKSIEIRSKISDKRFWCSDVAYKTFLLCLKGKSPSQVWNNFHDSVKRGIKKAKRYRVKIVISYSLSGVRDFYSMNMVTRKKHGLFPQPYLFFFNLWKYIIQKGLGFVMIATIDDTPISSAIFLFYKDILFYKYGASYTEYLSYRPNNLIFWEVINWAFKNGIKYLDFGRTSFENEGLMRFKRHWGTKEMDLPYYYYPKIKGISSIKHSSLRYKIVTSILRKTPLKILQMIGERFYQYMA